MQKEFEKVFLNKYGFYELKNKPSVEERKRSLKKSIISSQQVHMNSTIQMRSLNSRKSNLNKERLSMNVI